MAPFIINVLTFWRFVAVFSIVQLVKCNRIAGYVQRLSYDEFQEFVSHGSVRLVFFKPNAESTGIDLFLKEYENAAKDLSMYGIKLGLVDCSSVTEKIKYCAEDDNNDLSVRGFKNNVEKIALPLETLYDANSIVASTLHLTLIHNVPIVQQMSERQELESHCKGSCAVIFTFQRILGTHEHRVFIEVAYRYMKKYVFALTTTEMTTIGLRRLQSESENNGFLEDPAVWILHCDRIDSNSTEECPQTTYRQQMELEQFLDFVQTIEIPDWIVVTPESENISYDVYDKFSLNSVYFLYDDDSEKNVEQLAPKIGVWFKGSVGVYGVNANKISHKLIGETGFNVESLKLPSIGFKAFGQNNVVIMNEYDNAYKFISDQLFYSSFESTKNIGVLHHNFIEPISELDELQQDDEVANVLAEYQWKEENFDSIPALNDVTFQELRESNKFSVVLYYLKWDSLSQITLRLFSNLIKWKPRLSDVLNRLDCFEWTDICENVSVYPTIRLNSPSGGVLVYDGALKTENLFTTIQLFRMPNPITLYDTDSVLKFISEDQSDVGVDLPSVVLIGIDSLDGDSEEIVNNLGEYFHGKYLIGKCVGEHCKIITDKYFLKFPFAITFKPEDAFEDHVAMKVDFKEINLREFVTNSSLQKFAKLTPINFVRIRQMNRPLVIFFRESDENEAEYNLIGKMSTSIQYSRFTFVWMNLQETIAQNIQSSFLNDDPSANISLIIVDHGRSCWYRFSGQVWSENEIKKWLMDVTTKEQAHAGVLPKGDWKPRLPGFDYLKFIDEDQIREVEEKFNSESSLDPSDTLHQSRIYRYPGSSEKKYKNKINEIKNEPHSEL